MPSTATQKVFTGTNAATVSPDAPPGTNAANWNFLSADLYDSSGVLYQSNPLIIPAAGTYYSFERWVAIYYSGAFTSISAIKIYLSSGTLPDPALILNAGVTPTGVTPTSLPSSVATAPIPTTLLSALDVTPIGGPIVAPGYTQYLVLQLAVGNAVVTPMDIGTLTYTVAWTEV